MAVGNNYLETSRKQDDHSREVDIITLSVSVGEVQEILTALQRGSLKYAIRPAGDVEIADINPLKLSSIVKDVFKITPCKNNVSDLKQPPQFRDNEQIFKYWGIIFIEVNKDNFLKNNNAFK